MGQSLPAVLALARALRDPLDRRGRDIATADRSLWHRLVAECSRLYVARTRDHGGQSRQWCLGCGAEERLEGRAVPGCLYRGDIARFRKPVDRARALSL